MNVFIRATSRFVSLVPIRRAQRPEFRVPDATVRIGPANVSHKRPILARAIILLAAAIMFTACQHEPMVTPGETLTDDPGGGGVEAEPEDTCDANIAYFEQDVLPIFVQYCTMSGCHNTPTDDNDEVVLTTYANITDPRYFGDIWDELQDGDMPPPEANVVDLPQEDLNTIYTWIQQGAQNNSCESGCQTGAVTYTSTIRPIIEDRCQGCHSGNNPQGGLDFSTWNDLNSVAGDGRLALAIQHQTGAEPMPPSGPSLSQCRIDQILAWIQDGAPNN